jgi:hypothetical protein
MSNIGKKFGRPFTVVWIDKKIFTYVKDEGSNLNTT